MQLKPSIGHPSNKHNHLPNELLAFVLRAIFIQISLQLNRNPKEDFGLYAYVMKTICSEPTSRLGSHYLATTHDARMQFGHVIIIKGDLAQMPYRRNVVYMKARESQITSAANCFLPLLGQRSCAADTPNRTAVM